MWRKIYEQPEPPPGLPVVLVVQDDRGACSVLRAVMIEGQFHEFLSDGRHGEPVAIDSDELTYWAHLPPPPA